MAEPLTDEGGEQTGVPGENPWRRASENATYQSPKIQAQSKTWTCTTASVAGEESRCANRYTTRRPRSAQTIVHTATQISLQIRLATSSSHTILTPGQPLLMLILQHEVHGRGATTAPIFTLQVWLEWEKWGSIPMSPALTASLA